MTDKRETIKTKIWLEEAAADNPFAAEACYCSGYDVYGDLLGQVSWVEYLYLLFRLELPSPAQARLLETLAVAIAHPGIRDHSVRAAMNAGAGGSTRASALMAALAVGAGNLGGGREILQALRWWQRLGTDLEGWLAEIERPPPGEESDVWPAMEHTPGFDPHGVSCPGPVKSTLAKAEALAVGERLTWLRANRRRLEAAVGYPLAMTGVAAAGFADLGFDEGQAEILYLLLRLPGAAAHALEQERGGWQQYPFFGPVLKPLDNDAYWAVLTETGAKA